MDWPVLLAGSLARLRRVANCFGFSFSTSFVPLFNLRHLWEFTPTTYPEGWEPCKLNNELAWAGWRHLPGYLGDG